MPWTPHRSSWPPARPAQVFWRRGLLALAALVALLFPAEALVMGWLPARQEPGPLPSRPPSEVDAPRDAQPRPAPQSWPSRQSEPSPATPRDRNRPERGGDLPPPPAR